MLRVSKCRNFVTSIFICYIIQRKKWGLISFFFFQPCEIRMSWILYCDLKRVPIPTNYTRHLFIFFFFFYIILFLNRRREEKQPPHSTWTVFFFSAIFLIFCCCFCCLSSISFSKTQHSFYTYFSSSILCLSFALKGFSFFKWIGLFLWGEVVGDDMCIE